MRFIELLRVFSVLGAFLFTASISVAGVSGIDYKADRFVISTERGVTPPLFDITDASSSTTGYESLDNLVSTLGIEAISSYYP
ncbi:MAG: hypothetical protein V3W18_07985, partial [candidate division Zixibacteria bacterium]